jgi:hypothetical protein
MIKVSGCISASVEVMHAMNKLVMDSIQYLKITRDPTNDARYGERNGAGEFYVHD